MCPTRNLLEDFGTEAASRREAPSFVQTAFDVSAHRYDDERLVPDVFNRLTRGSGGTNSAQVRFREMLYTYTMEGAVLRF